jgi:LCP family protein required for cell wall assembly
MRDSYVKVSDWKSTKLNAAYAKGGAKLLIDTIETNYEIHIEGYASVNFDSFEAIVNSIGKVTIELGKKEAKYLNWANYISNPEYRNVKPGINQLNGNQVLGYCRVRKVETLGGVNNDYGRTLRQRRALSAIFDKVKTLNIFDMFTTANDCMGYVNTSLTSTQIRDIIELVAEEDISKIDTLRLPVDGMFNDPKSYEGTTYPLVYDWEDNIDELHKFIYGEIVDK